MKRILRKMVVLSVLMFAGATAVLGHNINPSNASAVSSDSDEWILLKEEAGLVFSLREAQIGDDRYVFIKIENQSETAANVSFELIHANRYVAQLFKNQSIEVGGSLLITDPTVTLKLLAGESVSQCSIHLN